MFWLHGFFELSDTETLSDKQVKIIKEHLDLVFDKVTPTSLKDKLELINEARKPLQPKDLGSVNDTLYC